MPQLIFWKDPSTGMRPVIEVFKDLKKMEEMERKTTLYVNDYQTLNYAIRSGLDNMIHSPIPEENSTLEMPIMQPSYNVTVQSLFERLKSPKNEVCVFRINHETLTAFRIVFFIYYQNHKPYYIATHALFKRGRTTKGYDRAIEECDEIAASYFGRDIGGRKV